MNDKAARASGETAETMTPEENAARAAELDERIATLRAERDRLEEIVQRDRDLQQTCRELIRDMNEREDPLKPRPRGVGKFFAQAHS